MSQQKSGGLLSLFKKEESESPSVEVAAPKQEGVVDTLAEIAPLLMMIHLGNFPVRVFLDNSSHSYYSHFEAEEAEDEEGNLIESVEHVEEGEYLLLAPMDPPSGNAKIRSAGEIRLEFASKNHYLECTTQLDQITRKRQIRLAFPTILRQKPQKRVAVRVPVWRDLEIVAAILRPSGGAFKAKLLDVSVGGTAFYPTSLIPRIADHSRLDMTITYPEGKLDVDAIVLGSFSKDGEQVYRSRFLVESHKMARSVNELVSFVERDNIRRKKMLEG